MLMYCQNTAFECGTNLKGKRYGFIKQDLRITLKFESAPKENKYLKNIQIQFKKKHENNEKYDLTNKALY